MTAPDFSDFFELPLVGILRGCAAEQLPQIIKAVRTGGMRYLEITMNTPGAEDQIRAAIQLSEGSIVIGAGTVTSEALLQRALDAGASFIVTPALNSTVIEKCIAAKVPVFPSAFTPTEVCQAWQLGATAVKIFPAELGGPEYIQALRGPFPDIRLMPTGGVDLTTLPEFIRAGANAFGIGSPLFRKERLEASDWPWLEQRTRAFVQTYETCITAKT